MDDGWIILRNDIVNNEAMGGHHFAYCIAHYLFVVYVLGDNFQHESRHQDNLNSVSFHQSLGSICIKLSSAWLAWVGCSDTEIPLFTSNPDLHIAQSDAMYYSSTFNPDISSLRFPTKA